MNTNTEPTLDSNESRYQAVIKDLTGKTPKLPMELKSQLDLVSAARLASLMSTDEGKEVGDKASEDIGGLIKGVNDHISTYLKSNDDAPSDLALLSKRSTYEVLALNEHSKIGHSADIDEAVNTLLARSDERTGTLGRIALLKQQDLFDKKVTATMPTFIDFIKGEDVDIPDSQLSELAVIADRTLNTVKKNNDSGLIQGSFVNLANHKVFEEILSRIDSNPTLSMVMFENLGKSFTSSLYEHAIQNADDSHAMSLLSNSEHGLLRDSKPNATNNPQVRELLQLVVKSGNSNANLDRLVGMATTPASLSAMLENLTDVHNNHYDSQNLANIVDKVGSTMSADQLKHFGEAMVKNYRHQPVLPALQKILDIGEDKGYEFGHLERASGQIRKELNNDFQNLTLPLSSYSSVTIDFPSAQTSIALRDARSASHLMMLINKSVDRAAGGLDFEFNGADSLLDSMVEDAVTDYMTNGDAGELNRLMSSPVRSVEKDTKKRSQLLFEANKQNRSLPPLPLDDMEVLSDVVDKDAAVYSGDKILVHLEALHSSNDILAKLAEHGSRSLSVSDTGLGKDYDKKLLASLKDCADNPDDKQKQSNLNELVGLPVTELSSKIEKQQENKQSDGNFIKKVTDSLLTTARSPK